MKATLQGALLCGSAAFLVTITPEIFQQIMPVGFGSISVANFQAITLLESLLMAGVSALVAGAIGYIIGDILSHPEGKLEQARENAPASPGHAKPGEPEPAPIDLSGELSMDDPVMALPTDLPSELPAEETASPS